VSLLDPVVARRRADALADADVVLRSERDVYYDKVGNSEQWWELPLIARALGTAITGPFPLSGGHHQDD
jgi:hypothetical protein